uniref:Uncharacterized protein n=1 Tax=Odontella aurita TaxID=265563 RepID=A0A7S4HUE6_9STRA|mmetsp:Transcript_15225/g.44176  ORF Transcript_15225/g.44176 Transcript_15225/m.44176 type:complete len:233 (+) Transcript_15225:242-940(+)
MIHEMMGRNRLQHRKLALSCGPAVKPVPGEDAKSTASGDFMQKRVAESPREEEHEDSALPAPSSITQNSPQRRRRLRSQSVPYEWREASAEALPVVPVLKRSLSDLPKKTAASTKRSVSFDQIEVREYSLTLGDHVPASGGPPLSLGWDYDAKETTAVEKYEFAKESHRRTDRQLYLKSSTRRNILSFCCGFDEEEIQKAEMVAKGVRKNRKMARRLYVVESAGRKLKWFAS